MSISSDMKTEKLMEIVGDFGQFQDEASKEIADLVSRASSGLQEGIQAVGIATQIVKEQIAAPLSTVLASDTKEVMDAVAASALQGVAEVLENQADKIGASSAIAITQERATLNMPGIVPHRTVSQQIFSPHRVGRTLQMYSVDDEATIEALGKQPEPPPKDTSDSREEYSPPKSQYSADTLDTGDEFRSAVTGDRSFITKSFTAVRTIFGFGHDPAILSGKVNIYGVDEVIARMKLTKMEKHFLLTRWVKARNSQKMKAHTYAKYYRFIGLVKVLCGVVVPVFISSSGQVTGDLKEILTNASIIVSILGTLVTALEDFFEFGLRCANRMTCLSRMDREFWEFQGLSGIYSDFQIWTGAAFRRLASTCEEYLFNVEENYLQTMGSTKDEPRKGDT